MVAMDWIALAEIAIIFACLYGIYAYSVQKDAPQRPTTVAEFR